MSLQQLNNLGNVSFWQTTSVGYCYFPPRNGVWRSVRVWHSLSLCLSLSLSFSLPLSTYPHPHTPATFYTSWINSFSKPDMLSSHARQARATLHTNLMPYTTPVTIQTYRTSKPNTTSHHYFLRFIQPTLPNVLAPCHAWSPMPHLHTPGRKGHTSTTHPNNTTTVQSVRGWE